MSVKLLLREKTPSRTFEEKYKSYRSYKKPIIKDFNNRCGYCDSLDFWCGGPRFYHIDHFKPKSIFPELETEYSNLVYACPYCNIFKSNDWSVDEVCKYIDPCEVEYSEHLYRERNGAILPSTKCGEFISEKLHLYLLRHRVTWMLTRIQDVLVELNNFMLDQTDLEENENVNQMKNKHFELSSEFLRYMGILKEIQSTG